MNCRACGAQGEFPVLRAREMMFGSGEAFDYFKCPSCGCLQISEIPSDLSRHYPSGYYSFHAAAPRPPGAWRRLRLALPWGGPEWMGWLRRMRARPSERVLDVGAGGGSFLRQLWEHGFSDLSGLEPFAASDIVYAPGFSVLKRPVEEAEGPFDLLFAHHAYEHMPDPLQAMLQFRRLLAPGGRALIRIPVCDSEAFERYGADWVQLDAPRHLHLHTRRSLALLAEKAGFRVTAVLDDSSDFQFWASEQYRRGIALRAPNSWAVNRGASPFSRWDIARYRWRARRLNARGRGDSACFFLC